MSKVKSPVEKKRKAYERDHFSTAEYPHNFRIGWPRKRAGANRCYRHKIRQKLNCNVPGDTEQHNTVDVLRGKVQKWRSSVETLRERVGRKLDRRQRRIGAKAWRAAYRKRIEALLHRTSTSKLDDLGNRQPDGPASGNQPFRSETNHTSAAAGSRR